MLLFFFLADSWISDCFFKGEISGKISNGSGEDEAEFSTSAACFRDSSRRLRVVLRLVAIEVGDENLDLAVGVEREVGLSGVLRRTGIVVVVVVVDNVFDFLGGMDIKFNQNRYYVRK